MATLRLYTCLDVTLPPALARGTRTNLWIIAARRSDAIAMLAERDITYQEQTFGGPVQPGPVTAGVKRAGLAGQPAVHAYPVPWEPGAAVVRIDSPVSSEPVTIMSAVMPHLVTR